MFSRDERKESCATEPLLVARAEVRAVCVRGHDAALEERKACALWQRLLRGSCALLDCFDEAGVRYLVLDASVGTGRADLSKLSPRERDALRLRAQGTSLKSMASALNVSVATASRLVANARRKVGPVSCAELLCMLDDDCQHQGAARA